MNRGTYCSDMQLGRLYDAVSLQAFSAEPVAPTDAQSAALRRALPGARGCSQRLSLEASERPQEAAATTVAAAKEDPVSLLGGLSKRAQPRYPSTQERKLS